MTFYLFKLFIKLHFNYSLFYALGKNKILGVVDYNNIVIVPVCYKSDCALREKNILSSEL